MSDQATARIRRFNRAVTREVGALDTSYLGRGRPLGAARVLHLCTSQGTDVAQIREALALDSGLLSRLLRTLEADGLVETATDPADRRRRIARLTPQGQAERAEYERLNDALAQRLLTRAPHLRAEILAAVDLIANLLNADHIQISRADPDDPRVQSALAAYARFLTATIPEEGPNPIPLPLADADSFRPPQGAVLLATSDGLTLGTVSLRTLSPGLGEVKRLYITPEARGLGLARRLMRAIEDQARSLGLRRLNLDTNGTLTRAVALYQSEGWLPCAPYSGFPATHWFTKPL
jgi:DNA-binding MarR family transcriptional regulator